MTIGAAPPCAAASRKAVIRMKMDYSYSEKDPKQEERLYEVLLLLENNCGVLLGEPSLEKLFHFISGYGFAYAELEGYRFHFDREFQTYVMQHADSPCEYLHWNEILQNGRSKPEAFEEFYRQLRRFLSQNTEEEPTC